MNYCPECGIKLTNGAAFCPQCGAKLSAAETNNDRAKLGGSTLKLGWFLLGALIPIVGFILAPIWWRKYYPRAISLLSGACASFAVGLMHYFHVL